MQQVGEQDQRRQQRRQELLTMTEVVLEVIALGRKFSANHFIDKSVRI